MSVKKYATVEEFNEAKAFLFEHQNTYKREPDIGTCVSGNGIQLWVLKKGKRKPVKVKVFPNLWTQCEQEKTLKLLMNLAKKHFPDIAHLFEYDCGRMD